MTVVHLSERRQVVRACDRNQHLTSPLAGLKVLVVEDEAIVADAAMMMLAKAGAEAIGPCSTVAAALSALEDHQVDLALLDVDLNGMRSHAVSLALTERQIPYVAATGHTIAAAIAGAQMIVNKPYTLEQLQAALEGAATS